MRQVTTDLIQEWTQLATDIQTLGGAETAAEHRALRAKMEAMERFNTDHPEIMLALVQQQEHVSPTEVTVEVSRPIPRLRRL